MAADKIKKKNTKNEQINETVKDVTVTQEPVTENKEVVEAIPAPAKETVKKE